MTYEQLQSENARMRAALQDFVDRGLAADLHPTLAPFSLPDRPDMVGPGGRPYEDYLARLDQTVRERAGSSLGIIFCTACHTRFRQVFPEEGEICLVCGCRLRYWPVSRTVSLP